MSSVKIHIFFSNELIKIIYYVKIKRINDEFISPEVILYTISYETKSIQTF